MDITNTFGKKIRSLRKQHHLTLRDVAAQAGIHYSYLSKFEGGKLPPPANTIIIRLASILKTDERELLDLAQKLPLEIEDNFRKATKFSFGQKLKQLRIKRHLSQQELASQVGVDTSYISKLERGLCRPPSQVVISALAQALNIKAGKLLDISGKNIMPSKVYKLYGTTQRKESAMTGILNMKFMRLATAVALVLLLSVSLWFASPTPAKAVNITVNNATGTTGSTVTITANVVIQRPLDVYPVQGAELRIFDPANPGTYSATYTNLPLPGGPSQSAQATYSAATNPGGAATITGTSGAGWGGATTTRQGYGYGYGDNAWVTDSGLTGYGYGYTGVTGSTTLQYLISWTPPASWPAGTYEVQLIIYGVSADLNKAWVNETTATVTLGAPASGGGGALPTTGVTSVTGSTTSSGMFTQTVTAKSADNKVSVNIQQGVVGKKADGTRLTAITVFAQAEPPAAPPAQRNVIGLPYDLGPSGATFSPPITVSFTYDPTQIPEGVDPADLELAFYDAATGEWVKLTNIVVDPVTNTISGQTSHFTVFAIFAPEPVAEETPTETATATPTATETATATPTATETATATPTATTTSTGISIPSGETGTAITSTATTTTTGETNWTWVIVIGVIGAIAAGFVAWYGWTRLRRD